MLSWHSKNSRSLSMTATAARPACPPVGPLRQADNEPAINQIAEAGRPGGGNCATKPQRDDIGRRYHRRGGPSPQSLTGS